MAAKHRTRLDAATRRAQIVESAAVVFQGRNPHEVTFDEIAAQAGVSRALVYNYFRDKGDLLAAVYLRSLRRLDTALQEALTGESSIDERLPIVVRTYLRFGESDPKAFRNLVDTESAHHPAVRNARRERLDRLAEGWGGTPEAQVMASGLLGMLEAATVEWIERHELGADFERVAEVLTAMLRRGLLGLSDEGLDLADPPVSP